MAKYLTAHNYKHFTVGQKWSDGSGTMEIIKIKIPSTLINDSSVKLTMEMVSRQGGREEIIFNVETFDEFLKLHALRVRPIDLWPDRKDKEVEGYTNNRFDKID